uniref:venom phosphodiesterase-like n=1 Tax=Styela clava TaxID=7725 RepID=UPI00193A0A5E|nr:venom phosphodiesterase-like [Styela clava]
MGQVFIFASFEEGYTESCTGRCMETWNGANTCHCDENCSQNNNCCADYVDLCITDSANSCYGRCFNSYGFLPNANCYCDSQCSKYGNCCSDFVAECADENLCENRCFFWYNSQLPCQCNDLCLKYGNCCPDYYGSCIPGSCVNRCGDRNTNSACHCDSQCSTDYDCCEDFADTCTSSDSCEHLCESAYDSSRSCQCNDACAQYGNCCSDYEVLCRDFYLCNGVCNITKNTCSCTESCLQDNTCCTDYEQSCNAGTAWLEDECTSSQDMVCPNGFDTPPVILLSIDGFRNSYFNRHETPNMAKLASCGVHAPYVRPAYPTLTFPNHYSIVTGLYPEFHGIVANRFYDHEFDAEFQLGKTEASNPRWWGGEPIWVTASNQGLKSASYFWVGSDVNITRYPDYYYPYDGSVPYEDRIYQVLQWLDMPVEDRPSIILLYMDMVDHAGHDVGPDGHEVDVAISQADDMVGMLMDGLKARNLDKCVNLMILADHGMANTSCDRMTYIDQYGVDLNSVYFRGGAHGRVGKSTDKTLWNLYDGEDIKNKLQCKRSETHFQAYLKYEYFPKRMHNAYSARIDDVSLVMDDEWLVGGQTGSYSSCDGGTHGWDNENKQMRALFLAHGASFKRSYNFSEPFDNVEIYNFIAKDLLNLTPRQNNGTLGSLGHLLKNQPHVEPQSNGDLPNTCPYPSTTSSPDTRGCSACQGEQQANDLLNLTPEETTEAQNKNMLVGLPEIYPESDGDVVNYCVLSQPEYITVYNWEKKQPYFAHFVLDNKMRDMSPTSLCVRPDIRIDSQYSSTCSDFENNKDVTGTFLYHPYLSMNRKSDAEILSNIIPVYRPFVAIWEQFSKVLNDWAGLYNGISVATGPIFDYDFDGNSDTKEIIQKYGQFLVPGDKTSTPIPTHVFVVAMRCRNYTSSESVRDCANNPKMIDIISFIIPNYATDPCYKDTMNIDEWVSQTVFEHVARLHDVELLTSISFLSDWRNADSTQEERMEAIRLTVHLPEFEKDWMQDLLQNITPSPDVYATTTKSASTTKPPK